MICDSVILAAGLGRRMRSSLPKVLHPLGGRPILAWSIHACREASGRSPFVVVGPEAEAIRESAGDNVHFVEQVDRLGTGHALLQSSQALQGRSDLVLVISADMPLLRVETLRHLIQVQSESEGPLTLLAVRGSVPRGFGRVVRNARGQAIAVVEEAEATKEQLALDEYNTSVYCFHSSWLWDHLPRLPLSPKGEYYLTDIVAMAAQEGGEALVLEVEDPDEVIGVNTREHLAEAEAALRRRINRGWMLAGVTMLDPLTTYIGPDVVLGRETVILPNTHLLGQTVVGEGCTLGPNAILRDATVGKGCKVLDSVIEEATLEDQVDVGPFSHLRRGAHLKRGVHVGNFAEVKNSTLEAGAKMGHFSYVGDASIGEEANIGAGTVTCNFGLDGRKNHTEVGAGAFIGSDTMLVAPVRVGQGAVTGAGAVVTKDVPDRGIAVGVPARVIRKRADDE